MQRFAEMGGVRKIQDRMVKQHHVFFILSNENARWWMIISLVDHSVSYPLPELRLCGPEFFTVATNNPRGSFLLLFLLHSRTQGSPLCCKERLDTLVLMAFRLVRQRAPMPYPRDGESSKGGRSVCQFKSTSHSHLLFFY